MALTISTIFETMKYKYKLNLLTNPSNTTAPVTWVYLAEDCNNTDFIRPGSLIITTGLSISTSDLQDFITHMIPCEVSGIIINTGRYIQPSDITTAIAALCDAHNIPLLTMPWDIYISDFSVDICNRIFASNQDSNTVASAFESLIRSSHNAMEHAQLLESYNFNINANYCVITMKYQFTPEVNTELLEKRLLYLINTHLLGQKSNYYMLANKEYITFIASHLECYQCKDDFLQLHDTLTSSFPSMLLTTGIGNEVTTLLELATSYHNATAALIMCNYNQESIVSYYELGFFRILLSLDDTTVLRKYYHDKLQILIDYDHKHHTDYLENLHQFLLHDGHLQEIATVMNCHRNTINYRLNAIRELLDNNLDDTHYRFELYTAFQIRDYLSLYCRQNQLDFKPS